MEEGSLELEFITHLVVGDVVRPNDCVGSLRPHSHQASCSLVCRSMSVPPPQTPAGLHSNCPQLNMVTSFIYVIMTHVLFYVAVTHLLSLSHFICRLDGAHVQVVLLCLCPCRTNCTKLKYTTSKRCQQAKEVYRTCGWYGALRPVKQTRLWRSSCFGTVLIAECECTLRLLLV